MGMAREAAKRSTCLRLNVGAVVAKEGRTIRSSGYSGAPRGLPHCSPYICNPQSPCTSTVHAEMNAIASALGVELDSLYGVVNNTDAMDFLVRVIGGRLPLLGDSLYSTHAPCIQCASIIRNSGIKKVIYETPYRKTEGIELLRSSGVIVECFTKQETSDSSH